MNDFSLISLVLVLVLQAFLVVILLWREVVARFPFFFAYNAFAITAESLKFLVHRDFHAYYYVFLATQPCYALLGYLAVAEVFHRVFDRFRRLWWFRLLIPLVGVGALGLSVLIAALRPPVEASHFLAAVFVLEILVRLLQLGVFLLILALGNLFTLLWRQHSFGIASGFGLAAVGTLAAIVARSILGTRYAFTLQFVPSVTYFMAVVIWLVSFLKPLPADPLQDLRPLLTPDAMDNWAEGFRQGSKAFKRKSPLNL